MVLVWHIVWRLVGSCVLLSFGVFGCVAMLDGIVSFRVVSWMFLGVAFQAAGIVFNS